MALTSNSGWSPTPQKTQFAKETEPSGLTLKQEQMQGSVYPGAFKPSEPQPQEGTTAVQRQQEQAQEYKDQPEKLAKKRQELQQSGIQDAIAKVSDKIGGFKYSLQGYVNEFLTQGTTDVGLQTKFDPVTGKIITTQDKTYLDPAVAEKEAQRERILSSLKPFLNEKGVGGYEAKSFMDVARNELGTDANASRILGLVNSLDVLERSGAKNSTEAKNIRAQLDELDTFGMATSLKDAKKNYERLMGIAGDEDVKWYGETGKEGKTALELAQLTHADIESELEKANVAASGLFSGEVESSLKKAFDTQSAGAQRAQEQNKEINTQLKKAVDTALSDTTTTLGKSKQAITTAIEGIKPQLTELIKGLPEAKLWGDLLADTGSITEVIMKAISDPSMGLDHEQRAMLSKYLGEASGSGELGVWLSQIQNSTDGSFSVDINAGTNNAPKMVDVKFGPETKNEIIRLLMDKSQDPEVVQAKVKDLVLNQKIQNDTELHDVLGNIASGTSISGDIETDKKNFIESLKNTFSTLVGSKTETIFKQVLQADPELQKEFAGMGLDITKMTTKDLADNFEKLSDYNKKRLTESLKKGLEGTMNAALTTYNTQANEAVKKARVEIPKKKKELDNNIFKLNELKKQASPENVNKLIWDKALTNFRNQFSAIGSEAENAGFKAVYEAPWFQEMLTARTATQSDAYQISRAMSYPKLVPLIKEIDPYFDDTAIKQIQDIFNAAKVDGFFDFTKLRALNGSIEKEIINIIRGGKIPGHTETYGEAYISGMDAKTKDLINKRAETINKSIDDSLSKLTTMSSNLDASIVNLNDFAKQLSSNLPMITDVESVIKNLLPDATPKADGTLQGMEIKTDASGNKYMSFGGQVIPMTPENIQQLYTAINADYVAPELLTGKSDLISGMQSKSLGSGISIPKFDVIAKPKPAVEVAKDFVTKTLQANKGKVESEVRAAIQQKLGNNVSVYMSYNPTPSSGIPEYTVTINGVTVTVPLTNEVVGTITNNGELGTGVTAIDPAQFTSGSAQITPQQYRDMTSSPTWTGSIIDGIKAFLGIGSVPKTGTALSTNPYKIDYARSNVIDLAQVIINTQKEIEAKNAADRQKFEQHEAEKYGYSYDKGSKETTVDLEGGGKGKVYTGDASGPKVKGGYDTGSIA